MSYTVDELNTAIEEDTEERWEGNWYGFYDRAENTHEYVKVPEGTKGAHSFDGGKTFEKYLPKAEPGVEIPGLGRAHLVEDHGGGEGSGEERWFVFAVTDAGGNVRHFRRNGYYASFVGSNFDGPTEEVRSVEKLVSVWEAFK